MLNAIVHLLGRVVPAILILTVAAPWADAAPTHEQSQQLERARLAVRAAGRLINAGRTPDAIEQVKKAQAEVAALQSGTLDASTQRLVGVVLQQLGELYVLIELEGLPVPKMPEPKAKEPAAMAADEGPSLGERPPLPEGTGVSFSKDIAPMLVAKCGNCHVDEDRGRISMANYTALMAGSPDAGAIILPGKGTGSRIYEVIESGDMPRGGGTVTQEELALLVTWIEQGARNDAPSPNTSLRQLARAQAPAAPQVVQATGKETVSFGLDVAPILATQCSGCHGTDQPRAQFSVQNFERLLRGGDSGSPVVPGKGADSLLIKKLRGTAGDQMPLRRPPLSDDVIAKIETWINEGAKFDGETPTSPVSRVAAFVLARNSTPEQLTEQRQQYAAQNWRLAIPDAQAVQQQTKNFIALGNVGEATLAEVAKLAEDQAARLGSVLNELGGESIVPGRVTLFVFANRYDYAEVGTMLEKRQLPRSWSGHWRYDVVDPYIAILYSRESLDSLDTVLAHQVISMKLASQAQGNAPRWFTEGAGRALAAKLDPRDPLVAQWDEQLETALSQMSQPDDFLTGKLSPEDTDIISYSFAKFLLSSNPRFTKLVKALEAGTEFETAVQQAYGGAPAQLAAMWAKQLPRK